MKLVIRPEALDEVHDAIAYLVDKKRIAAARGLWKTWDQSFDAILGTPDRFPVVTRCFPRTDVREYWISRYKYRVIYLVRIAEVEVLAVRHGHRLDTDWLTRLPST